MDTALPWTNFGNNSDATGFDIIGPKPGQSLTRESGFCLCRRGLNRRVICGMGILPVLKYQAHFASKRCRHLLLITSITVTTTNNTNIIVVALLYSKARI